MILTDIQFKIIRNVLAALTVAIIGFVLYMIYRKTSAKIVGVY